MLTMHGLIDETNVTLKEERKNKKFFICGCLMSITSSESAAKPHFLKGTASICLLEQLKLFGNLQ